MGELYSIRNNTSIQVLIKQNNGFGYQNRRNYLGINAKYVALDFIHGVEAIGHGA